MAIDIVMFDWSGTISDDFECVLNALNSTLIEYGVKPVTSEHLRANYKRNAVDYYRPFGITDIAENIQGKFKKYYDENYRKKSPVPFEGTDYILTELMEDKRKMIVISAHPQEFLEREVKAYGFSKFFINGAIFGGMKDKSSVIIAQSQDIQRTAMVGDTWVDMEEGKKAEVVTVGVLTGYNDRIQLKPSADYVLQDLSGLPALLRTL